MSQKNYDNYGSLYWDLDDILAEEELVLTKFSIKSY